MTVHLIKLAVGADSVDDLIQWQAWQVREAPRLGRRALPVCGTRSWPKRAAEVLDGGSLYWVIKGAVLARQRILAIDDVTDEHGPRCGLYLDPDLRRTTPAPKRAFQGWRYLSVADAPADLADGGAGLPEALQRELAALGAW